MNALRAEVAEMRARDQDRSEQIELMQNRVLVLEVGPEVGPSGPEGVAVEAGDDPPSPQLRVVTLSPEQQEAIDEGPIEGDLPEIHGVGSPGRAGRERRPALALAGAPRRSAFAQPIAAPGQSAGHDSLGVIPMDGGASPPAAPAPQVRSALDEAAEHVRAGRRDEAIALLRSFLLQTPGHGQAPAAQMLLAEYLAGAGRHLDAIGELERLRRRFPGHRPADAMLQTGLAYAALGDRERAREILFQVVERHPGTAAARRATERVAQLEGRRQESRR